MSWHAAESVATTRFFIVYPDGHIDRHAESLQAYTDADYSALLSAAGLKQQATYPSLTGKPDEDQAHFSVIVARKLGQVGGQDGCDPGRLRGGALIGSGSSERSGQ
jgi:hypothetical protein